MSLLHRSPWIVGLLCLAGAVPCGAQTRLSLQDAVAAALDSRPAIKAEAERAAVAQARVQQAGLWPNPEFQFTNENLRPGQRYGTDVDTLAVFTQPLDILGKRGHRIDAAEQVAARAAADLDVAKRRLAQQVQLAYWAARGAQERRDSLRATVENFQRIVDFHTSQLSVGAIPEQDVLRVRLEHEQLQIAAHLAAVDATNLRVALFREIGRADAPDVVLTEPLDRMATPASVDAAAIAQRADVLAARAAVTEAEANRTLQDALARPDLGVIAGYKRTLLPDAVNGVNTSILGFRLSIPLFDRNQGNRTAAAAEQRRQDQLLAETEQQARADLSRAQQEYELRRAEVTQTLTPLREHATTLAGIARAAYEQGAVEILRLLDAERARFDAERAWVDGMVQFQQSVVNLAFAQGAAR